MKDHIFAQILDYHCSEMHYRIFQVECDLSEERCNERGFDNVQPGPSS